MTRRIAITILLILALFAAVSHEDGVALGLVVSAIFAGIVDA